MIILGAIAILIFFFGTAYVADKIDDRIGGDSFLPVCIILYVMEIAIAIQIISSYCE